MRTLPLAAPLRLLCHGQLSSPPSRPWATAIGIPLLAQGSVFLNFQGYEPPTAGSLCTVWKKESLFIRPKASHFLLLSQNLQYGPFVQLHVWFSFTSSSAWGVGGGYFSFNVSGFFKNHLGDSHWSISHWNFRNWLSNLMKKLTSVRTWCLF